jgi:hypothetical protein
MALFGLLGSDKPTPKNIDKTVAKLKERYAQPEYRRGAMERLLSWNTPETLDAVLARFTVVAQSPHWDEEEKRWLVEELVERGQPAREALSRFLLKENHIAFAASALRQLCPAEGYVQALVEALKARDPDDYRSAQGKQELIAALGDVEAKGAAEALLPYLDDHSDDVRCTTVDVIEKLAAEEAFGRLAEILTEDLHSDRVLRHTAGAVSRLKVPIDPAKALQPAVTEDYVVKDGSLAPAHEA